MIRGSKIKRGFQFGLILLVFVFLSGCIQFNTVVKVKPDGSGFIEETFLMRKDFLQQLQSMAENMAKQMGGTNTGEKKEGEGPQGKGTQPAIKSEDFFNVAKLKEKSMEMGEGVTYVSGSKVASGDFEGFKAVYAFKDINKVRLKQDFKDEMPSVPGQSNTGSKDKKGNITFIFTKGSPDMLVIKLPSHKGAVKKEAGAQDKKPAPANKQMTKEEKAFMTQMFKGMKMALSVEVAGTILETNAAYKDGSTVTLLDVDFGKMVENPEQFVKMSQFKPETLEEMRRLMKYFPGIKVELNNEVKIKFQ
jgi:hypothetical protein